MKSKVVQPWSASLVTLEACSASYYQSHIAFGARPSDNTSLHSLSLKVPQGQLNEATELRHGLPKECVVCEH